MSELLKKIASSFFIRICGVGIAFALNIFITKNYELKDAGLYFWLLSIVLFFIPVVTFGQQTPIMRHTVIQGALNKNLFKIATKKSILSFFAIYIPIVIFAVSFDYEKINYLLLIFPSTVFIAILYNLSELLRGIGKTKTYTIFVFFASQAILYLVNVLNKGNLENLILNYYISAIIPLLLLLFLLSKQPKTDKEIEKSRYFSEAKAIMASSFLQSIITYIPAILLGIFETTDSVALLHISLRTALLVSFVLTALNTIIGPKLANFNNNEVEFFKNIGIVKNLLFVIFIAGTIPLIVILVFAEEILSIFGDEFSSAKEVFRLLVIAQFINLISGPVILVLNLTNNQNCTLKIMITNSVVVSIVSLFLIPLYSYEGAAIAIAIGIILQNLQGIISVKRKLNVWLIPTIK